MRAIFPRRWIIPALVLLTFVLVPVSVEANSGRLIVTIEGTAVGPIQPSLELLGADRQETTLLGPLVLSAGFLPFDDLRPGTYRLDLEGGAAEPTRPIEVGIYEGRTTVVRLNLEKGAFRVDPFRPDPFGVDETWDDAWLQVLPGRGAETAQAALTSPDPPRQTAVEGIDVSGAGFRHRLRIGAESIARSTMVPTGMVSAASEEATHSISSRNYGAYVDLEGATGTRGQSSWEGTFGRSLPGTPGKPRLFTSFRAMQYLDGAPSVFVNDRLPHNGLEGLELLARLDVYPQAKTELSGLLYGEGTIRKYYVEPFRANPQHGPREERANLHAALRATHQWSQRIRLLGEVSLQRTLLESGDGIHFDNILGYGRDDGNPGSDEELYNLYWLDAHAYDYFRRMFQVDWTFRVEGWRDPGTDRSIGAGVWFRTGSYRSYEHLKPSSPFGPSSANLVNSIGYNLTGEERAEEEGMEPGDPSAASAFVTARRPVAGGEMELGLRGTRFSAGQKPIRDLSNPLGADEASLDPEDLGDEESLYSVDPRIAFTRPLHDRVRLWISGGGETRIPPSEAVYYSPAFLENAAFRAIQETDGREVIFGNPALKPERAWGALGALGIHLTPALTVRVGVEGELVTDAITPQAIGVGARPLFYYVNDGTRDLIDFFTRLSWEPSRSVRMRASYDLSKMRTETIEPSLLDLAWYDPYLPTHGPSSEEGLPMVFPISDDGTDRDPYPSSRDRRHRISLAAAIHPPPDLLGETGRVLLTDIEIGILFRAASAPPFTQTFAYQTGLLEEDPDRQIIGPINGVRADWTNQLDLRIARTVRILGSDTQIWLEVTNLTDELNATAVYTGSGEGDDDAYLDFGAPGDLPEGFADLYRDRIRDSIRYDDPRLIRAGIRIRLP